MSVRVSPKYQVVIPEEVRKSLNIVPGMQMSVIAKGGVAYLVPVRSLSEIEAKLQNPEKKVKAKKDLREKKDRKV